LEKQAIDIICFPRQRFEIELINNNTYRPNITFITVKVFRKDLGRHVDGHSDRLVVD
jgi:hypothetical protein